SHTSPVLPFVIIIMARIPSISKPPISRILHVGRPIAFALGIVILLSSLVIGILGENVVEVYRILVLSAFGSLDDFGYVLFNATPLIFTGLAVTIGFKCGLFNIGCEGQLYVGGFAAAWMGFHFNLPAIILIPFCILAAMVAGAGWAAIAGILKAKFGVHEVINTIMMNFIAIALTSYFVTEVYQEAGQMIPHTPQISETAHLPRIAAFLGLIPKSNPLNVTFLLALIAALFCQFFLKRTQYGYELRLVGDAPEVATYGGINVGAVTVWTMMLSGAIASLAGVWDVMGYRHRFLDNFSPGFGYTGIAAALLGRNHPFGVCLAAVLFGTLNKGALDVEILMDVPRELFLIAQAVLIICLASIQLKWQGGTLSKTA
ncbi:MAG: ABC transporter permease, partial [Candidatus Poribacteria bacterium]|nr:ABC transporter permease [Candidatus Poribacteria bacterium]